MLGGPVVLLGRAVVQGVVGVGQRGPARRAGVLVPQPHRTGRGTERSARKAGGGASGTRHLSHAAHATVRRKNKASATPETTNTQVEMRKMNKEGEWTERRKNPK